MQKRLAEHLRRRRRVHVMDVGTHHEPGQRSRRLLTRIQRLHHPAVAQNGGRMAQLAHLLQPVGDIDDGPALLRQTAQGYEEARRLLRGEHGSRLVENDDPWIGQQATDDLHPLTLAHGQVGHQHIRIQRQAVLLRNLADACRQIPHVVPSGHGQGDVLRHRERLEQGEVLEHHADAQLAGARRRGDGHRPAAEQDFTGIRLQRAIDDLYESGFAGAVLAQQGMDLPRPYGQGDVVIGRDLAEMLRDAAHLQQWRGRIFFPFSHAGDHITPLPPETARMIRFCTDYCGSGFFRLFPC